MHQLHHEVRPAGLGGAGVEHLGDVRVVHHRQRLPLGLEAGDDLLGVQPRLDDLQRDLAADGVLLLGHVDDAEPALADPLEQLVAADDRADRLLDRRLGDLLEQRRPGGHDMPSSARLGSGRPSAGLDPPRSVASSPQAWPDTQPRSSGDAMARAA